MAIGVKVVKGSSQNARRRRHFRVRKKVVGTAERPRLVVHVHLVTWLPR